MSLFPFATHSPRRSAQALLAASALLVLACGPGEPSGGPVALVGSGALARPATSIPVAFTVSDAAPNRIRSDGLGEYVNGQGTVTAEIDTYGNLQVSVTSALPPARNLTFDYDAPADPANTYRPNLSGSRWFRIKSNKTNNNNPGLHEMTVGSSACYNVTFAHGDGVTQWVDNFNPAADAGSTYALVTRTSSTAWTLNVGAGCAGTANRGALSSQDVSRKNQPRISRGYYDLQVTMVIRTL